MLLGTSIFTDLSTDLTTFSDYIVYSGEKLVDVLGLFTQEPVSYFTALAFLGACIAVARKVVPMKRK
jgi:hypothetical protein